MGRHSPNRQGRQWGTAPGLVPQTSLGSVARVHLKLWSAAALQTLKNLAKPMQQGVPCVSVFVVPLELPVATSIVSLHRLGEILAKQMPHVNSPARGVTQSKKTGRGLLGQAGGGHGGQYDSAPGLVLPALVPPDRDQPAGKRCARSSAAFATPPVTTTTKIMSSIMAF